MTWSRWRIAGGAALVALLGAACGGGGADSAPSAPVEVRTASGASASIGKCPASVALGDSVKDHGSARAPGTAISLEAGDAFFAPTCITGVSAGKVKVTIKNTGSALHNFSIPEQEIDVDVPAGKTITVDVDALSASTIFNCKYHRTSGMVGAFLQGAG